ncbi:MAG: cupin domain-containing protein [Chloroflexi bacterium]|nr:cupin domain-containing protein [Chloroflexota bacterium]
MLSVSRLISLLHLQPLPLEGGYYRETYRSRHSTAIYYLLTPETCSALHRLPQQDEIFHFYLGDPVAMLMLCEGDGMADLVTLGPEIDKDQRVQVIVPRNFWQGCFLKEGGRFALMGTTVAPPFNFDNYEAGQREELLRKFPGEQELITRLTPPFR